MTTDNYSLNRLTIGLSSRADELGQNLAKRTFVQLGELASFLETPQNQVLFGRRGSGKTHALLFLAETMHERGNVSIYIDMRQLGSSGGMYGDPRLPVAERATQLLSDILERVHDALFSISVDLDERSAAFAGILPLLDDLIDAAAGVQVIGEVTYETSWADKKSAKQSGEFGAGWASGPKVALKSSSAADTSVEHSDRSSVKGRERPHIVFGALAQAWRSLADELRPRGAWIFLDEWTSLPTDVQPILADLLRRAFLPLPNVVVKIGAVERTAHFEDRFPDGDYIGIELGSDIPQSISIDEYLVADRSDDDEGSGFLEQLVFRHLIALIEDLGYDALRYADARSLREAMFADSDSWQEFSLSAEGVPRDALNILSQAARQAGRRPIEKRDVRLAAKDYYLRQKSARLARNRPAQELLARLLKDVLGTRKSRIFALRRDTDSLDPRIRELYESRLIHLIASGISQAGRPDVLYDVFAIDYGCFVAAVTGSYSALLTGNLKPLSSALTSIDADTVRNYVYELQTVPKGHRKRR